MAERPTLFWYWQDQSLLQAMRVIMPHRRILVVEDEFFIRLLLAEVLADQGYEVIEAETGDEAVDLIDYPDSFDAIVTDIHMPGRRNGIDVARYARERHPTIPVIYCTGRPDALDKNMLGTGQLLIAKPYVALRVADALNRLIAAATL